MPRVNTKSLRLRLTALVRSAIGFHAFSENCLTSNNVLEKSD